MKIHVKAEDKYYLKIILRFVGFTFIISWTVWALLVLYPDSNYFVKLWIAVLGLYGPSIAGIILSYKFHGTYWQHYVPDGGVFLLFFGISGLIGIGYMYQLTQTVTSFSLYLTPVVIILILIASALTAYMFALMVRSPLGFETRHESPLELKSQIGMIAFAVVLPLLMGIVSFYAQRAIFPNSTFQSLPDLVSSTFHLPLFLIAYSFLFSGAFEEVGWRGYLTPKFLQRINPLVTGLIIGIIWTIWHFPLHLTGFYADGLSGFWYRFLWNVPLGIVFTWYYIKSKFNLLGAIILHGAFNLFSTLGEFLVVPAYIITAIIMIIESKMWESDYRGSEQLTTQV